MEEILLEIVRKMNPLEDIELDTLLIEEGILDSLSLIVLIGEIEEKFNIKIPDEALFIDNFYNIAAIAKTIESCK